MHPSKKNIYKLHQEITHSLQKLGDAWVPKYKRMMGVPHPLPEECMSSWVERIASQMNISARIILAHWGIKVPSFWLDSGAHLSDLERVSTSTMKPKQELEQFLWQQSSILSNPSFACLMAEPANRRPIYRYCEKCLAADAIPFIRHTFYPPYLLSARPGAMHAAMCAQNMQRSSGTTARSVHGEST